MKDSTTDANIAVIDRKFIKKTNFYRRFVSNWQLEAMAIPGVIWMIIFVYLPMYGILIGFKEYNLAKGVLEAPWVGLKYYKEFIGDSYFWKTLQNTLGISFLRLGLGFPVTVLFALLLNEIRSDKYKRFVQTSTYLPHFFSWAVLGTIIINWFSEAGPLNNILVAKLGLLQNPVSIIADPKYYWPLAVLSNMWKETGWGAIVYLAAISSIDPQLYESALLDGANRLQRIWYITLPSILPIISLMLILQIGNLLSTNFDQTLVLSNALNMNKSMTLDMYVYRTGFSQYRFSYATAIGTFRSVVALILLVVANKSSKKLTGNSMY